MISVPTLYLRDVPEALYKGLRRRARQNRRSMNAEAIAILQQAMDRQHADDDLIEHLRSLRFTISEGVPAPEEMIRQARDAADPYRPRR
jgi:plasmid stability protein